MTEKAHEPATIVVKSDLEISIEEVNHAVAEITKMDAVIGELEQEFANVIIDVSTPKGMKAGKEARAKIRKPRFLIENLRKAGKAPVLDLGRKLDGKAREQTERLLALEGPIHDDITAEEQREEREREAKIAAEQQRVEGIRARIDDIRLAVEPLAWDSSAADVNAVLERVADIPIDDLFDEFEQQANDAKGATIAKLHDMLRAAENREAKERRIAAEREELEKLRAEQAKRDEAERKKREAKEAAERKKREAEEAKRRDELAEQEQRIAEENDRLARERQREARRQEIVNQINVVKSMPSQSYGLTAAELSRLLARAEKFSVLVEPDDSDLLELADTAKAEAVSAIKAALKGRRAYEAEQAELARQKAEQEQREREEAERKAKAEADARKKKFPGEAAIINALIEHFGITEKIARAWLSEYSQARAA